MKHRYISNCSAVFDLGYYTHLCNDDIIKDMNKTSALHNGYRLEYIDRDGLIKLCGRWVSCLISWQVNFDKVNILKHIKYVDTTFSPDDNYKSRIIMDVEYDKHELNEFCLKLNKKEFIKFLENEYKNNEEFCQILPKTIKEFKKWKSEYKINTMIEYLLFLTLIKYRGCSFDFNNFCPQEFFDNSLCVVDEKNGRKFKAKIKEVETTNDFMRLDVVIGDDISDDFSPYDDYI